MIQLLQRKPGLEHVSRSLSHNVDIKDVSFLHASLKYIERSSRSYKSSSNKTKLCSLKETTMAT